jgi:hypothetical protein
VSNAVPDTSGVSSSSFGIASITANWTSTSHAIGGDFGSNPRNSIRIHGDSTAQSSLMYRFKQALENLCNFSTGLPTTGGELTLTSEGTIALTASLKSTIETSCDSDVSGVADGTEIRYAVEDISGNSGTEYQRKVSFDIGNTATYKDFFYYTVSGTLTKFMYIENSTNKSAALFEYDTTTGVAKFEFSESATAPFTVHYRVLLDENSDAGRFTAWVSNNTDQMRAVVGTLEGGGSQIAVSYAFVDDGSNDITEGNACVATSNFSIATDNTLTCTGVTGASVTGYTSDHSDINGTYILSLNETAGIQFTNSTDILTAAEAN